MLLPARATGSANLQGVSEYGTMLEIQSVQMLPDGRSMVEAVGTHRFKLLEKGNLDGYTVGRIERYVGTTSNGLSVLIICRIDDISPVDEESLEREAVARAAEARALSASVQPVRPAPSVNPPSRIGTPLAQALPAEEAAQTTEEYMAICRAFIEQLRSGSAPWLLQRLNTTYGTMPTDPCEFSYWMALVSPLYELKIRIWVSDRSRSFLSTSMRKPDYFLFDRLDFDSSLSYTGLNRSGHRGGEFTSWSVAALMMGFPFPFLSVSLLI